MSSSPDAVSAADDRARRCSEAVTLALLGQGRGVVGKWLAVRLSDGRTDGNIYDLKADAVRHQLHPNQCAYVCVPWDGMGVRQAKTYLSFIEGLYSVGADIADPATHIHMPNQREAIRPMLANFRKR